MVWDGHGDGGTRTSVSTMLNLNLLQETQMDEESHLFKRWFLALKQDIYIPHPRTLSNHPKSAFDELVKWSDNNTTKQ